MTITLTLPVPKTENARPTHKFDRHRRKMEFQRATWLKAASQALPLEAPPERVRISAHFVMWNRRDEDNLTGSLKWVLDALKQRQPSEKWRRGVFLGRGYFVDDDPAHLELDKPTQEMKRREPARLVLTITTEEAA